MITRDQILERFVAELTHVVGALLETTASSRQGTRPAPDGFVVTIEASEGPRGRVTVFFARPGAEALATALTRSAAVPPDAQVIDSLRDISSQTTAALTRHDVGCALTVVSVEGATAPPPDGQDAPLAMDIDIGGQSEPLQVVLSGQIDVAPNAAAGDLRGGRTLDVIMDIDLPLVVRFGRTELPLKALTEMGPGSVIDLGRSPDDPVEVLISNRVVARGEVVIVAGHYGVRVRDVVSPAERARSLEAELA